MSNLSYLNLSMEMRALMLMRDFLLPNPLLERGLDYACHVSFPYDASSCVSFCPSFSFSTEK